MSRPSRWIAVLGSLSVGAGLIFFRRLIAPSVSDEVLQERVRARVRRVVSDPSQIDVIAAQGYVTLIGHVSDDELLPLCKAVASIPGVEYVENRCARQGTGEAVS